MFVHRVGHQGEGGNVAIVPQATLVEGFAIGRGMDFGLFRGDDRPAPFGLDAPEAREGLRLSPADARAVRYLIETVARGHCPDADRLEQDIVPRVAAHDGRIASRVSASNSTIMSSSSSVTLYGGASRMWSPMRP